VGHMNPGSGGPHRGRYPGRKLEGRVESFSGRHRATFFAIPSDNATAIS